MKPAKNRTKTELWNFGLKLSPVIRAFTSFCDSEFVYEPPIKLPHNSVHPNLDSYLYDN